RLELARQLALDKRVRDLDRGVFDERLDDRLLALHLLARPGRVLELLAHRLPVRLRGLLLAARQALGKGIVERRKHLLLDATDGDPDRRLPARELRIAVALGKGDLRLARLVDESTGQDLH